MNTNLTKYNIKSLWVTNEELLSYPQWLREQIIYDRASLGLSKGYEVLENDNSLIIEFKINQIKLLDNTPKDWVLPKPYIFNLWTDNEDLIYKIGGSYTLFKYINRFKKLSWFIFKHRCERDYKKNYNEVKNIYLKITYTLLNKEINYERVLPSFDIRYWDILYDDNFEDDSYIFLSEVYWPLMKKLGYINPENEEDSDYMESKWLENYNTNINNIQMKIEYLEYSKY